MQIGVSRWARSAAVGALLGLAACAPQVSDEAVLAHTDGAAFATLSVSGSGFGAADASAYVEVVPAAGAPFTVSSQSADTVQWSEHHVVVKVAAGTDAVTTRVHTAGGWSPTSAAVREYDAQFFSTFDATGLPTTLIGDAQGRIWVNTEFHSNLSAWDPTTAVVQPFAGYPLPAVPIDQFCFPTGCGATKNAIAGEAIALDSHGRVWFSEGGTAATGHPDHSRILAVESDADPIGSAAAIRLYNIPGDRNGVYGVAWDEERQRVWFTQTSMLGASGKLISFDPENISHDDFDFDWTTSAVCNIPTGQPQGTCSNAVWRACQVPADCVLAEQICPPGVLDDASCYHEYPVPAFQPAGIAVHPDGSVWYADFFFGGELVRLDPSTGAVSRFVLSPPPSGDGVAWPWQVRIAPNGDVWATEFNSDKLARVPLDKQDDDCDTLVDITGQTDCQPTPDGHRSPACVNPCVSEFSIPGAWVKASDGTWSSPIETVWFDLGANGSVLFDNGYRLPNGQWVFWPRLMEMFPSPHGTSLPYAGKGVYAAPNGVVWLTDFFGRRLLRLTPRP